MFLLSFQLRAISTQSPPRPYAGYFSTSGTVSSFLGLCAWLYLWTEHKFLLDVSGMPPTHLDPTRRRYDSDQSSTGQSVSHRRCKSSAMWEPAALRHSA